MGERFGTRTTHVRGNGTLGLCLLISQQTRSTEIKLCPKALLLEFYTGQLDSVSKIMSPDGKEHSKQQPVGAMPHSNHNTHLQGCAGTY